ncbi:MAG: hypothetical protein ABL958_02610 [Bdellovibrionia bacterium]
MAKFIEVFLVFGMSCVLFSGCSSMGKSASAGGGIGALAGGIAGSLLPGDESSKPKNVLVGAAAGATIGALGGALVHRSMEEKEREAFEKGKSVNSRAGGTVVSSTRGSGNRRFTPPKIERRWVEDEIRGNTLIEAHYEQIIVEEGRWE